MKKIMLLIGWILIIGLSIILFENYIYPREKPETIYIDTCNIDSVIESTQKKIDNL